MDKKEMAARPETCATTSDVHNADGTRKTKIENILAIFFKGERLNRFEAEAHQDHCLHTTVSTLQNEHGIVIERKSETVPCVRGTKTTRVKRCWLKRDPENVLKALSLLEFWGAQMKVLEQLLLWLWCLPLTLWLSRPYGLKRGQNGTR